MGSLLLLTRNACSARFAIAFLAVFLPSHFAPADENEFYKLVTITKAQSPTESRSKFWQPAPDGLPLEVSGLASLRDGRLAVAIRKGEIWLLDRIDDDPPTKVTYHRFAEGLHEPLGVIEVGDSLYTAQRSELTRLRDVDGDDVADEYFTVANGWAVTGNYHEYAYGPKQDAEGNFWITLNVGMGFTPAQKNVLTKLGASATSQTGWRGWGLKIMPGGRLVPICGGFRSPSGLGANSAGDMFTTDQQGNWVPTCSVVHMRPGLFFGHPDSLASAQLQGSPLKPVENVPANLPLPEAYRLLPSLGPPAVWLPYKKAGQSATDILCDRTGGKFGPFENQLFIGEFTLASIQRVFLEKVGGEYQGACFPFRNGFASAVIRMVFGKDGSMFVGLSNRGWSSVGDSAYGLQRLVWTGKTPFEIKEMRAKADGFELTFTLPVDARTASDPASYRLSSYTYRYHEKYGSDEIDVKELPIREATVAGDRLSVRVHADGLRLYYVHELECLGVRATDGKPLLHNTGYYTLNRIP